MRQEGGVTAGPRPDGVIIGVLQAGPPVGQLRVLHLEMFLRRGRDFPDDLLLCGAGQGEGGTVDR